MADEFAELKAAKAKILEGQLTFWNARLDALNRTGDLKAVIDHMKSPAEGGDNCGCNSACGVPVSPGELAVNLARTATTKTR